jgi:microcystin-dependent protein
MCDGQAYLQTQYPALFNVIGGYYGWSGGYGGNNTFNVPDARGRATVGAGAGPGLTNRGLGGKGGEEYHALSYNEMPVHNHGINDPGHAHSVWDPTHTHGVSQSAHAHGVADPGHAHGIYDPGHDHYLNTQQGPKYQIGPYGAYGLIDATGGPTAVVTWGYTKISTYAAGVGIGIYGADANISINGAYTGIGIYGAGTGISTQNAGASWGHNNMQPFINFNKIIKA